MIEVQAKLFESHETMETAGPVAIVMTREGVAKLQYRTANIKQDEQEFTLEWQPWENVPVVE